MVEPQQLPENVTHINIEDKEIYLVGTAHLSKESVNDVKTAIQMVLPDSVCIELCQQRYGVMTDPDNWRKMNIFRIIREKKSALLLAQLILSSFYRRLGEKLGIQPGAEMLEAIKSASAMNAKIVLADRDIEITLKRVWRYLSFWNKVKMLFHFIVDICVGEEINEKLIEQLKTKDQLETVLSEFADKFPEVKRRLLDERDIYIAQKIRNSPGQKIVAVVGAGHIRGIKENITEEKDVSELISIPAKSKIPAVFKWVIPAVVVAIIAYGFFTKGAAHGIENIYIWILVTGLFSAAGAAVAFAHPLSILTAFIAAPIMTLHPLLATGWFSGLVEAYIRKPTVEDFETLPDSISTLKGFWKNAVTRILLVTAFTNLGAMLGIWIAGAWILKRSF
jgi:pheromone shutdown-related protein TraB